MKFSYWSRWLFLFLGVILPVACMPMASPQNPDTSSSTPGIPKDTNGTWTVELFVSGGFAGVQRNIKISSSGDAIIMDEKKPKPINLDLLEAEVEKLSKLVVAIEHLPNVSGSSPCVDCFQYEVDVVIQDSHFHASYNDETLKHSGIKPLVFELVRLMNDALEK
jgi:hypothetical protein